MITDENYTPEWFVKPCRAFLNGIDLDPFSNAIANQVIQADHIFTIESNAFKQDWSGFKRKWVNPPYSKPLIEMAIAKTIEFSYIGETLLLANTSSSTKWFHACMAACSAYLHPYKRINFDSPYRESKGNRYDQTLFYFGNRPLEFAADLITLGRSVAPIRL
ncbi:DNA N-6-adenine-methyltransferase [Pseudanabaena sp. 'Roaring Creek']|uniref:DNA N-6-adenine-methyltransferase n=1 Tax=Pseudanabaena sp. 'Roaring Creek' TaxID=1681830 RepID=UPI0006D793B5|nr:DNA N-6-adenine-methyltransferase [Pseudanabaena sp. 'Roaring Creek']